MIIVSVLIGVLATILLLPTVSDLISLMRLPLRRVNPSRPAARPVPSLLFLVPAHNEEKLITSCVRSLLDQRYPAEQRRAVVIADNCSDRTAELARAAGAQCLERHDREYPGKPRAIAWALGQLDLDTVDSVIIIDADTVVDADFGLALAEAGDAVAEQAFQAYFDVRNPSDGALTRMALVLAAGNYRFAYALKRRVGLNAPLLGNGMCIGTSILAEHGWNAFSIAEDWELYTLLTMQGVRIASLPEARLFAEEARSLRQSSTQRQRWTAGKLTVLGRLFTRLVKSTRIGLAQKIDAVAELTAPGPVLHLGVALTLAVVVAITHAPAAMLLLGALGLSVVRLAVYAMAGLLVQPNPLRCAASFAFLPLYALWRLGAAIAAMKMLGNKPWVKTARQ